MPVHNVDIAEIFEQIADLLDIQGDNPFRIRAYRNAARTVRDLGTELSALKIQGVDLTRLPGIGKDLADKINEILRTGGTTALKKLKQATPRGLPELLKLPGLGPKRVKALQEQLDIHTLKQLRAAAASGKVRSLPGFGPKSEQQILQAIETQLSASARMLLATAAQYAQSLMEYLHQSKAVQEVVVAGSYRRAKETVGDLDILVTAAKTSDVMSRFVSYDEVKRVLAHGETRATVILRSGLQVDLRVVPPVSFGAALHYFTGSKAHNIAVRRLGQQRGMKINEYGVFKGDQRIAGASEASLFESVGLPFIPPELREGRGEIEAATRDTLPTLIELKHLKGDLHSHSKASDGHHTLRELAEAANKAGLSYLAITEHSRHLSVAHGLDEKRLSGQIEAIDRLNEELKGITLLKGIEVDILEDGGLDLPDTILSRLDLVVGAVHSQFNLPRKRQTERLVRAMNQRYFTLLAHPSGRLLGKRKAYEVDMERIIKETSQRGCHLELNAQPQRLDLNDIHCRMAKDAGVLVSINSDAHRSGDFAYLTYGVGQARRGWLETKDVLNTRALAQLRPLLKQTMG